MPLWKNRTVLRGLEWLLGALTWVAGASGALAGAALVALAAWMASPHSLGQSMGWAAAWLARDGQTPLQVQGAAGSLLQGGTVEQLTWTQDTLSLQAQALEISWRASLWWNLLANRTLTLERLVAQELQIETRPDPDAPPTPPNGESPPWAGPLTLPWLNRVEVPFEVSGDLQLTLSGSRLPPLQALQGRYVYGPDAAEDSVPDTAAAPAHQLAVARVRWAEGSYTLDAALQAAAPHAVRVRLQGTVAPRYEDAALTNAQGQPLWLQAEATAVGRLGATDSPGTALPQADNAAPFVDVQARLETAGAAAANGPALNAEARLHPWRAQPVEALAARLQRLDLALFWAGAPRTLLEGRVDITPDTAPNAAWRLVAELDNRRTGPWDQGLLPVENLKLELTQDAVGWRMPQLSARLAGTTLRATGRAEGLLEPGGLRTWALDAEALGLVPSGLLSTLQAVPQDLRLSAGTGSGTGAPAPDGQAVALSVRLDPSGQTEASGVGMPLAGIGADGGAGFPLPALNLQGSWLPGQLRLDRARSRWQEAQLDAQGTLSGLGGLPEFSGQATLTAPGLSAQLQGSLDASGRARPSASKGEAGVNLHAEITHASTTLAWLRRTLVRLEAALQPVWDAPPWQGALPAAWHSLALQGCAELRATWSDQPPWAVWAGAVQSQQPPTASGAGAGWTVALALDGARYQATPDATPWEIPEARARITGSEVAQLDLSWAQDGAPWRLRLAAPVAYRLAWAPPAGPAPGAPRSGSTAAASMELESGQLLLDLPGAGAGGPGVTGRRAAAQGPVTLHWERTTWTGQRLQTQGHWQDLPVAALDAWLGRRSPAGRSPLAVAGLDSTLVLQGDWAMDVPLRADATGGAAPSASVTVRRQSGDVTLPPELARSSGKGQRVPAGLTESTLTLRLDGPQMQAHVRWASERMGDISAELGTTLAPPQGDQDWQWPDSAPIAATARATLPDLAIWSALAPPGWRVNGLLALDVQAGGTRAAPDWRGNVVADGLTLRSVVDGIDLRDGQLRARFNGRQLDITTLRLVGAGGDGVLEGTGSAVWPDSARWLPDVDLQMKATGLRVLSRADRRLDLSGDARMALRGTDLQIDSALRVDRALFLLPDETTPSLGSDVVVLEPASQRAEVPGRLPAQTPGTAARTAGNTQALRVTVNATLDLGREFLLRGQGLNTGLRGQLQINQSPSAALPRVTGEIRTSDGTYRAYGQVLQIEAGVLRFTGPYDNPTLDILAVRALPNQRAGVRILGTAQAPRLRLYADPDVPDSEKLALLVLGRPLSGAGAEAAILQQAALALLSGQSEDRSLVQALGLDELSFQGESQAQDGSTTAAAITLGKRISNRLYLAYNRSLAGAVGTVQVFYDVSRRVTLRAQAGDDNALDLIFTVNYD